MSMNDLLSDFVARVNNAVQAKKTNVTVLKNKLILNVSKKLTRLGYFESFSESDNSVELVLNLEKVGRLTRVSKPGKRVYTSYENMPRVVGGRGWNILSTSKGIMTNFEAKNEKVGGELLFQIY